jgi:hypothetical protein
MEKKERNTPVYMMISNFTILNDLVFFICANDFDARLKFHKSQKIPYGLSYNK